MKFKRLLTPQELAQLQVMASIRLPQKTMALILGISEATLERMAKHLPEVREALDKGMATGEAKAYQTAFQLATGYETEVKTKRYDRSLRKWVVETETVKIPPDPHMLRFWLKTQCGWRENIHLELSGPGGGPIPIEEMSPQDRQNRIEKLLRLREVLARDVTPVEVPPGEGEADGGT